MLVADDQRLVRTGFRVILDSEPGIEVIELARSRQPDVVLMDIQMPHLDGFEATRKVLAASRSKVLIPPSGAWPPGTPSSTRASPGG